MKSLKKEIKQQLCTNQWEAPRGQHGLSVFHFTVLCAWCIIKQCFQPLLVSASVFRLCHVVCTCCRTIYMLVTHRDVGGVLAQSILLVLFELFTVF